MKVVHRLATLGDASRLFELRRHSIIVLAPKGMSVAEAETWAATLTVAGMERKILELEIWVAEVSDKVVGWGAIRGDQLEENAYHFPRSALKNPSELFTASLAVDSSRSTSFGTIGLERLGPQAGTRFIAWPNKVGATFHDVATKPESEDGNDGGKNRDHSPDVRRWREKNL